ncbi:GIY-YIG nuclease family protein [Membranihabitans maritimus]|uniref:GIY-YIG nuclease family protein n=1 Tax=Membranihabitans maritimus TaxID=2904244 RepID=UPI001F200C87|nr:GIY-YIG nuclease family protein [Membranihabitans maritimus]
MSKQEFFPKKSEATPTIYAYELPNDTGRKGQPKVGFTNRTAQERIKEQIGATRAEYRIVLEENAMRNDGSVFTDFDVHRYLKQKGIKHTEGEWFECTIKDLKAALIAVKKGELK